MNYQQKLIKNIFSANSASHELNGVQVYHNNFIENGIRAMSISFPTVHFLLDEADFRGLARAFLLAHPKAQFDWADFGEEFAPFIMQTPGIDSMPYLTEVAELDWRMGTIEREKDVAFDAQSFNLLNERPHSELKFTLAPGFSIAKFLFPVELFYHFANTPSLHEQGAEREAFMQKLNNSISDAINSDRARSIMLWRPDYKAKLLSLSDINQTAFEQLNSRDSIASVLEHFEQQPEALEPWLTEQIQEKRIFGVHSTQ
ncbi:DNA-binding domain-containing protein [Ningiella sp. W23]|uniref:DNA-binding domain-containing protein n=1 Tax=Ningiella sp. W23 TaxID=3023715 RepID=UPI0037563A55